LRRTAKDLDIRILRELTSPASFQWDFRESYSRMGKRLAVDEETVRVTFKRAMELGLVEKWRLILNPELFGCKLAGLQFELDNDARKPRVLSQVQLVEGVMQILDFYGPSIRVVVYFEDDADLRRKNDLIASITGHEGDAPHWVSKTPRCDVKLKKIDWMIIKSLMHDPRKAADAVAKDVGASSRTVNRRLKRMTGDHVAYLIPVRNVSRSKGTICSYLVSCSEKGKEEVRDILESRNLRVDFVFDASKEVFIFTLVVDNPSQAEEVQKELRLIEGVNEVKMGLMKDFIFVDGWLDRAVAKQVALA
jgi:DNA-binding Lrp family transcriptional regulator